MVLADRGTPVGTRPATLLTLRPSAKSSGQVDKLLASAG